MPSTSRANTAHPSERASSSAFEPPSDRDVFQTTSAPMYASRMPLGSTSPIVT